MRRIKTNDEIVVIAGKDKGKRGRVIRYYKNNKVIIENINLVKRHTKENPAKNTPGGIIDKEMPIHISNVAIINPNTDKADKIGFKFLEDNTKVRYFKSNGEIFAD
ncbi:MAG: 50S ribosomal protein L24 [Thiomargarita sp.]|nr:50S ribosomal protein L24 [Thiomargarita sp.]